MSRIVQLSDLHCTNAFSQPFLNLLQKVLDTSPDVIVLGGDIADAQGGLNSIFKAIRGMTSIPILYLPGNHDLWSHYWQPCPNLYPSDYAFYEGMPKVCKYWGVTYLETESFILDNWLLSGTIGWYDYSFKYHQYATMPDEYFALNKYRYNNDANYIRSVYSDVEFANNAKTELIKRIKKQSKKVDNIAVFTHVPVFEEAVTSQASTSHDWNFGSSYFYNLSLGKELKKIKKLRLVSSGHTHKGLDTIVSNNIRFLVNPSDYGYPKICIIDLLITGDIITEVKV